MNIVAIIPARMAASRFPGKPMKDIHGMPMIGHVYERTILSEALTDTWVATCDEEIKTYVESLGGKAMMTADTHERCGDRVAEAMVKIEEQTGEPIDIVVLVQGDEPLVTPAMIDAAVQALTDAPECGIACLMYPIDNDADFNDPNEIKVVVNAQNRAMYMSREPIPTAKKGYADAPRLKQVCIIPHTREYLLRFNAMEPSQTEIAESIDLNRCLEHGDPVAMAMSPDPTISVDTPQDLERAAKALETDSLMPSYINKTAKDAA